MSEQTELSEQEGIGESVARAWKELPDVQEKARKMGMDVDKVTLGYAVDNIIGDDINRFGTIIMTGKFDEESSLAARNSILARLKWESGIVQLPQEIRKRTESVKSALEAGDWKTKEGYMNAYNIWKTDVRDFVLEMEKRDKTVIEARKLFMEFETRVRSKNLKRRIDYF